MKIYSSPDMNNLPIKNPLCYTENEINELFDLTDEEAVELTKVISDQVAINKVYSSQKTEERLAEILIEANKFATEQLGKSNFLSIDLATSVDEVVDETVLYLIDDGTGTNTYNQYGLIRGNAIPLGNTQCDLSNYVTNDQLETKLEDYAKKNEVLSVNDIVISIDENSTNSTVPGSATVKTFVEDSLPEIVTTLDDTVTNEQIVGAKTVRELTTDRNVKTYCYLSQLGLVSGCTVVDIYNAMSDGSISTIAVSGGSCPDAPANDGILIIEKQGKGKVDITFKRSHNYSVAPNELFIGTLKGEDGSGLVWTEVLTSNKMTTSLNSSSTNAQILGAKSLYDVIENLRKELDTVCPKVDWSSRYKDNTTITSFTPSNDELNKYPTSLDSMFYNCTAITSIDMSTINGGLISSYYNFARTCEQLETVDLSSLISPYATSIVNMFNSCTNLKTLKLPDLSVNKITNMQSFLYKCKSLTSVDLSKLDTSNVQSMISVFDTCTGLTSIDVSGFDTSNVVKFDWMFSNCIKLSSLNISNFNTDKATNMSGMFYGCREITSLDLSNFNTSNIVSIRKLLAQCTKLTTLKLGSNFIVSKMTDYESLFTGCTTLNKIQIPANFPADSRTFIEARLTDAGILANVTFETY